MLVVVSYDITSDRRRNRVCRLLKGYGMRVQYSVFECQLEARQLHELAVRMRREIALQHDSVRFYLLCAADAKRILYLGRGGRSQDRPAYIL